MYDNNAHFYDFFAPKSNDADLKIDFIKRCCEPEATLLDLGAGTGRIAISLAQEGFRVFCVEPSPSMRSVFLTKLANLSLDRQLTLYPQQVVSLSLDEPVDLAFAFDFFLLIKGEDERLAILKKLASLIKNGGLLIANFLPDHPPRATKMVSESSRRAIGNIDYVHLIGAEQLTLTTRKVTWTFETYYRGDLIDKTSEEFVTRQDNLPNLELLFERSGFVVEDCYGSFNSEAYTGNESSLVLKARKI